MPRSSREQTERTARTVLEHARSAFASEGYAATGLDRVAAAAGVTRGAVYHHFGSKLGLFEAVLREAHGEVADAVAAAAPGETWSDLEAGCLAFLRASTRADVRRILLVDGPAVLGWTAWRAMDAERSGALLVDALTGLLGEDGVGLAPLLSGAMNEAALWITEGGDRAQAERGLKRMLGALRVAAPPGD